MLWEQSVRGGKLRLVPADLAAALGITPAAVSRLITELVDDGRLKIVSRRPRAPGVYVVVDPLVWFAEHGESERS